MVRNWQIGAVKLMDSQLQHAYTRLGLEALLHRNRELILAPPSLTVRRFIQSLEKTGRLHTRSIYRLPHNRLTETYPDNYDLGASLAAHSRGTPRYIWDKASTFEVALTMRSGSYLSHASAVFLHGLTQQLPRTVYVNKEQSAKPRPGGKLSQVSIDRAFASNPRSSTYVFVYENTRFVLLSGKSTGNLETTDVTDSVGVPIRATKLERTLIDIVVRPLYAGGVFEVLEAYRGARDRASVSTLLATLKKLDYVYPYHQAIAFYLERAGYPESTLARFDKMPKRFDFYLTQKTVNPQYDKRWRVYFPGGLV
jgi:predicted transcriptional regulator of viral defense system